MFKCEFLGRLKAKFSNPWIFPFQTFVINNWLIRQLAFIEIRSTRETDAKLYYKFKLTEPSITLELISGYLVRHQSFLSFSYLSFTICKALEIAISK